MTPSERVKWLEKYTNNSLRSIAQLIGLKTPQRLYDVVHGKCGISAALAKAVCDYFPNINYTWFFTGQGDILNHMEAIDEHEENKEESRISLELESHLVPVLPVSAMAGRLADYSTAVRPSDCEYGVSPIPGADMIIPVSGESMAPEFANGSRVIVKKVMGSFLEWGKVYVLDTVDGPVIKELQKGDSDDELICVSLNPDPKYAPFHVKFTDILGIYRVLMVMTMK